MKVTQQDVLDTASLLNIRISEEEIETLTASFVNLIEYFSILDKATLGVEDEQLGDDIMRVRDGEVERHPNSEELIAKSEEYEDNFIIIPNIL